MKTELRIILVFFLTGLVIVVNSFANQSQFNNQDSVQKISPDGKQIVFVRAVKECPYTEDTGWVPSDFDELWSMNADGGNKKCLIKNSYAKNQDIDNYLGSFGDLHWSPDGKHIYFLCQNCATNALLYKANADGTNIKKFSYAHEIGGVVGGNPGDEYYGHIVVHVKKYSDDQPARWVTVLMNPDGEEVKEIDNIEQFWIGRKKI